MKRRISLILVVALLASLLVLPVSAETTAGFKMSVVYFEEDASRAEIIEGEEATTLKAGDLIALRLDYVNDATPRWLTSYGAKILFDSSALALYSFKGGRNGKTTVGPQVAGLGGTVVYNAEADSIRITEAVADGVETAANETISLAWVLFKVLDDVESGNISFFIDQTFENDLSGSLTENGAVASFEGIDFSDIKEIAVNGNPPTLGSIEVELTAGTGVYGTASTYKLTALSTKGKDISDLVTFKVREYFGTNIDIDNTRNTLTTTGGDTASITPAGTYHVYAEAVNGACTVPDDITGSFTIEKLQMNSLVVEIYNFEKGGLITYAKNGSCDEASDVTLTWYEGTDDEKREITEPDKETFKAATTYTVAITLTPYANYTFADNAELTVKGLGVDQLTTLTANGDDTYSAAVTVTTADKDEPAITLDPISAIYGDLLSKYEPTGTATFDGKNVAGKFAWSAEYAEDTTVGNVGTQTFNVVFTPSDEDNYKAVNGTVEVTVAQKEIDITGKLNEWSASEFTYDGERHAVELKIDEDLAGIVSVEKYTGVTEAQNVGEYTAIASLELVDPDNYVFTAGTDLTREHNWKINKGTIADFTKNLSLLYGPAQRISITPEFLGLPEGENFTAKFREANGLVSWDTKGELYVKRDTTEADVGNIGYVKLQYESDNYNTFYVTITVEIITKDDAGLTITGIPETLVYGGSAEWSYTVTNRGENGSISGSVTPAGILKNDPHKLTAIGVGTATVTITYSSDTTYAKQEFTITVTPKPISAAVSHDPITYGDPIPTTDSYQVIFTGLVGTDSLDGRYTVSTTYKNGDPYGEYDLTCELDASVTNYTLAAADVTGKLTVNKKNLTDDMLSFTETPDYTYDGTEKKPAVTVTDLRETDYTVSYRNNINAGVDTAVVTVTVNSDNPRYTGSATKTFTIAQAPISDAVIAAINDVTYNTKPQEPGVTVTLGETTLTAADYDVSYSEDHTNAGTVTVTVTGKGNYTGTKTATFEIKKADLKLNAYTISELCTETDTKTRTLPADFFLAGEITTGFSITLTAVEGGDEIFAEAPAVVEGKNEITFKLNGKVGAAAFTVTVTPTSGNYNSGSYTLTISTYDRTDVSGSIEFKDGSAVYTGSGIAYERATLSGNSFNMDYSYRPASTGAKLDEKGLPLTVGTYTVTAIYSDANSYGSAQAVFTITKATPTGTPTCTKFESSGKTLADTELSVGTIRPAGTIAWDLPLTTVLEDGKAYAWTFTPNDTHNYTTLTGTLIPYVDDGMDYIPGVIGGSTTGSFTFHDVSRTDYFYNAVKWAAENGIASGTSRYNFSPDAVCTRAQTVTFLWRAAGSPLPRYRVSPFTDVNASDYYYNAVLWAVEQGITTGLNATTFGPDETVTRGQVATFLYRAASAAKPNTFNPFTDVKSTAYNYDAILWAYDNRITTGTSDTTFSPNAFCTRAQIVTFLYRFYQGR